ncbi:MAG: hypothetical protein ACJ8DI_25650 [Ktedonobacteraceae bacterium]
MLDRVSEQYYTAREARTVLGLNEHAFQNWIKAGKITRTKFPGLGQGVYSKREIDRIARDIETALFLHTTKDLEYKAATLPEVDAETHLAHLIYGKRVLKPEAQRLRRQLVEINPEATWYLYDRDMLAASINILPVTHEAIEDFKQGVRGWLFVGRGQVKQFAPGEPLEVIVIDLMTTPTVPPEKRNFYAQVLLRDLADVTLRQWGMRGVEISNLYACGSTDAGRKLLRNRWFRELGEPVPGRVIFELPDVLHSDFHLLQPYQEAFASMTAKDAR